ncbi:MAG: glycosyltransferase family 4 protein [Nocardioides sp.]|nr:glycosyltransferase family 4 protein [Nocardioides sp.]
MLDDAHSLAGRHVVFLSWRDSGNPEAGGAELYLDRMATGLVQRGCRVTVFSARYPGTPDDEVENGIRYVRRGSKLSVYAQGMWQVLTRRLGRPDVVVDVQNGLPFFSPVVTRAPVVVLVHHVHHEQWPIVYPGLVGRIGWFLEHRVSPWLYRGHQYVAVSAATRADLRRQGVDQDNVVVVHNGIDPVHRIDATRAPYPMLCVVSRLVPHKRIEHAIDTVVALADEVPGIRLHVVGDGWWRGHLHDYVELLGAGDLVVFEGHVSEERKQQIYERAWLMLFPSIKEGWGLVVGEAGQHGTPTIAYAEAGGTTESIIDGVSGVLVHDKRQFVEAARQLLHDPDRLAKLSRGAREHSDRFTWPQAQEAFARVLQGALEGERVTAGL